MHFRQCPSRSLFVVHDADATVMSLCNGGMFLCGEEDFGAAQHHAAQRKARHCAHLEVQQQIGGGHGAAREEVARHPVVRVVHLRRQTGFMRRVQGLNPKLIQWWTRAAGIDLSCSRWDSYVVPWARVYIISYDEHVAGGKTSPSVIKYHMCVIFDIIFLKLKCICPV